MNHGYVKGMQDASAYIIRKKKGYGRSLRKRFCAHATCRVCATDDCLGRGQTQITLGSLPF